jgi:hypothetical protein
MQHKLNTTPVLLGLFLFCLLPKVQAQDADLAKQLANPVANLISVPIQNNIDMGIGEFGGSKLTTNIQPVIPVGLSEDWILITRTIMPVISQYSITEPGVNQTGLSDIVLSGFLSPTSSTITWGAGPVFLLPAGTNDYLTTKKWGIGPTAVVLMQTGPLTYGMLVNQVWSFAGDDNRNDVSMAYFFPFLNYNWKSGAGAGIFFEWTQNWNTNTSVIYLTPSFSGITSFGTQKVSFAIGPRFPFGSDTPGDFGIRANVTFVFPK